MVYYKAIEGKFVHLRAVQLEDAEFILKIRNDKEISKYLPPLDITIEQQKSWISKQRNDSDSYYFIFTNNKGESLGTISVYNIDNEHAEVGRFCSFGDSVQNMEAALLCDDFIFYTLGLSYLEIWVYKENKPIISLNQGFGCKWYGENVGDSWELFLFGKMTKEDYEKKTLKIRKNISIVKAY